MVCNVLSWLFFLLCVGNNLFAQNIITINSETPPGFNKDFIEINSSPAEIARIGYTSEKEKSDKLKIIDGKIRWQYKAEGPTFVWGPLIREKFINTIFNPGDDIKITYRYGQVIYLGKGSEKLQLISRLNQINDSLDALPVCNNCVKHVYITNSLEDYLHWNSSLNMKLKTMLPILESYKSKLNSFEYNDIKDRVLDKIEIARIEKFKALCGIGHPEGKTNVSGEKLNNLNLSNSDLAAIYDSTMNGVGAHWLEYERPFVNDPFYLNLKLYWTALRNKHVFFKNNKSDSSLLGIGIEINSGLYELAKSKYSGIIRESILSFFFWYVRGVFHNHGFTPEVEAMLNDYYAQSTFPKYKEYVKKVELEYRTRYSLKNAPDFRLTDTEGQVFVKEKLKGKLVILDFWFTGCTGCIKMAPALSSVEEKFKGDTNVVFLSISIDKNRDQWLRSVAQKKYTAGSGIQLYTSGVGSDHDMIKQYGVTGYPTLYVIDGTNSVIWADKIPDPRKDNGDKLVAFIKEQLVVMKDGPYVFYETNNLVNAYSLNAGYMTKRAYKGSSDQPLMVQTDEPNRQFSISLKTNLQVEPSEYARPDKQLVLSDIEGNFQAFRKLLQKNGVINDNFEWTFGNGHLVFAGDMFDRGKQVTECLWLIYSLEEKAKAAGGYVHFILGNHEILNLQGKDDYVSSKYKTNAEILGKNLIQLYNEESELGKWLRTKNVIEKIGDLLFMHGGISPKMNEITITIDEINHLTRSNFSQFKKDYGDEKINLIMGSSGPFWYRKYYETGTKKLSEVDIDATLKKFKVNRIITGHTIVADTISAHYNNKVINTDTPHAKGHSEALLIVDNKYYRVNKEGLKTPLF